MYAKIKLLADYWGLTIERAWLAEYHKSIYTFKDKPEMLTNKIVDAQGQKIPHEESALNCFHGVSDPHISYNFRTLYANLCCMSTYEASVEGVFSDLKRAVGMCGFRSHYDLLEARMILSIANKEYLEIYKKHKDTITTEFVYKNCYFAKTSNAIYLENGTLRTPLNSEHAHTKNYYNEARELVNKKKSVMHHQMRTGPKKSLRKSSTMNQNTRNLNIPSFCKFSSP